MYLNFTNGKITVKQNVTRECSIVDSLMPLSAKDVMTQAFDPSTYFKYEGKRPVSWDDTMPFYEFMTKIPALDHLGFGDIRLLFRETDLKLSYGQVPYLPHYFKVEFYKPKNFTDADFIDYATCDLKPYSATK